MNAHQQWVLMVKRICIEDCKRVASPCYPLPTVQHWRSNCPFIDSSFPASFDLLFLEMHTLHLKSWMGEMLEVGDSSSIYMNTCSLLQTSSCDCGCSFTLSDIIVMCLDADIILLFCTWMEVREALGGGMRSWPQTPQTLSECFGVLNHSLCKCSLVSETFSQQVWRVVRTAARFLKS